MLLLRDVILGFLHYEGLVSGELIEVARVLIRSGVHLLLLLVARGVSHRYAFVAAMGQVLAPTVVHS